MKFSFGIFSTPKSQIYLEEIISSIKLECADSEIIVFGTTKKLPATIYENKKTFCATKNKLVDVASYDNLVYMHDYIKLEPGWYQGFKDFGNSWDVCMTKVLNLDGTRFRDWCIWGDPEHGEPSIQVEPWCPNGIINLGGAYLADYSYNKTEWMYVSGAYFVAKKDFMLKNKFLDYLDWGQGEDVEWSLRVRDTWNYKLNKLSSVQLLKWKDVVLTPHF